MPILSGRVAGQQHAVQERAAQQPAAASQERAAIGDTPARFGWGGAGARLRFLDTCSNLGCQSGWMHLWRSRSTPIFEQGWSCSPECTVERVLAAVSRELDGRRTAVESHRHRVPLGLLMLEQGWIGAADLRQALDAQKAAGSGRLGQFLIGRAGIGEQLVTRALGLQWSCPVLALDAHDAEGLAALVPRLLIDAFQALPLRVAAGRLLYLGFEDRLDPVLALAIERMTGLRVESGLVRQSEFRVAHAGMLKCAFPRAHLIEAASEFEAARELARSIERVRPVESRLVRVHGCLWLRMWRRKQSGPLPEAGSVEDAICSVGAL